MAASLPTDSLPSKQRPSSASQETEKPGCNPEVWHLKFRSFCPSKRSSPIQCLKEISELCHQWLRPDLHSKEEILDQLILEQFMISVPPKLQALVKESGVKSCKELEKMLREDERPRQWSIVNWKGRIYLCRDPRVENREAMEDPSNQSEEPPSRGQASPELQNLPETEKPSTSQSVIGGSEVAQAKADDRDDDVVELSQDSPSGGCARIEFLNLPGTEPSVGRKQESLMQTVPESKDPDCRRAEQDSGSESVRGWDKASMLVSQDPQPAQGPDATMPQEDAKLDAVTPFTHILEKRDTALSADLQSLCGPQAPTCRGGASCADSTEDGKLAKAAQPQPVEPVDPLPGQARFECRECKRGFLYRSQFIIHQRSHTGERPFECSLCSKGFLQSSDLRVHQRTHTGEKPYVCRVCSKVFAHESTLLGHNRIHTKEKPYTCEHCGKCFSHKGNLNVHLRIHSDARPYACKECDAAFRQQGTLKRHVKTHSRMAPVMLSPD
ncbi:zinc finger and SCAN domain-containing protein 5B [Phodopus roborovskii]|uniref:zinc finger and SCAN domain-containing protein 5B n=1 Tax=Phodopus roborovskii TaxID=109678 RepID=UPI0021E359D3|nr:zinc finger and SCAN domain-containing protein 5B [Phodopus roborovskii]